VDENFRTFTLGQPVGQTHVVLVKMSQGHLFHGNIPQKGNGFRSERAWSGIDHQAIHHIKAGFKTASQKPDGATGHLNTIMFRYRQHASITSAK
jgi:hypothetical protein